MRLPDRWIPRQLEIVQRARQRRALNSLAQQLLRFAVKAAGNPGLTELEMDAFTSLVCAIRVRAAADGLLGKRAKG